MISWFRRWGWELGGLVLVSAAIALDKGFWAGVNVLLALVFIAVGTDVVSGVLRLLFKKEVLGKAVFISEIVMLGSYYVYLVFAGLIGVVYITAAPSLILGVLLYLWKAK